jgi:hypothetical protein
MKKKCVMVLASVNKMLALNRVLMRRPNSICRPEDVLPMHGASADTGHDLLPGCDRA